MIATMSQPHTAPAGTPEFAATARRVASLIERSKKTVVLTGAGMSAESGVPTFRDAHSGLWARFDPAQLATPQAWRQDKELVWAWYCWRMAAVRAAQPHAGHRALATLAGRHQDFRLVTQNVDDLHERAGSPQVTHLHGELFSLRCFACARPDPDALPSLPLIESPPLRVTPPRCRHCGGYLRPGVVWFHESLPAAAWKAAATAVAAADLVLIVGTSGLVQPAASLPGMARARGATLIEINVDESEFSGAVDVFWKAGAAAALGAVVGEWVG